MMIYIKQLEKKISTEVGIYKRKQESKKTRKHDQESDQEKTITDKEKKERGFSFLFSLLSCFFFINSHLRYIARR